MEIKTIELTKENLDEKFETNFSHLPFELKSNLSFLLTSRENISIEHNKYADKNQNKFDLIYFNDLNHTNAYYYKNGVKFNMHKEPFNKISKEKASSEFKNLSLNKESSL